VPSTASGGKNSKRHATSSRPGRAVHPVSFDATFAFHDGISSRIDGLGLVGNP
jgi:hypothetical protein